jgi:F-type H+-transporting ATPase subunit delta
MARPDTSARRYAEAALAVALETDQLDRWRDDLELASDMLRRPEVAPIVDSPAIPVEQRLAVLDSLLEQRIQPAALRLVRLLVERGRVRLLPRVSEEYQRQLNAHRGIVSATVASAVPLTADETEELRGRVTAIAGTDVDLRTTVDPALLGGLTIQVRDQLIDASVRGRLERLRDELQSGRRLR